MNSAARLVLAERVLGFSSADDTEVSIYFNDNRLTRFTRNAIHQNIATLDVTVRIRAVIGGQTGVIDTNDLREASLKIAVEKAIAMAKLAPPDPDYPGMTHAPSVAAPPNAFDERTADALGGAACEPRGRGVCDGGNGIIFGPRGT